MGSRQKALNDHVAKIRQYENERNIKNERLGYLNDKIKNLGGQIEGDRNNNEILIADIARLENEKSRLAGELATFTQTIQQLQEEYNCQKELVNELQTELGEANKNFRQNQDEVFQIKKQLEIKQTQLDSFRQELKRNSDNNSVQQSDIEELSERMYDLQEKVNDAEQKVNDDQNIVNDLKNELFELDKAIENDRSQSAVLNRSIDSKQNEYNLTKSLVENLEGFPEAIKFLKQHAKELKNIPLLSDILTSPEEYKVPIENFLENFMNYFVVDKQGEAIQAVNLLNDSSKGKANFFILENF